MQAYPKYKDSGIPWLGQIPEHWETKQLSQVAFEHFISNKEVHHQNLLSLSYGNIVRKDINTTGGLLPASFDTYQIVKDGNIVLRLTDLQNDHKSLRVGLAKEEGIVTSAYVCLGISDREYVNPTYLYRLLHTYDIWKLFYSMGGGIRQGLNWQGLRKLQVVVPPLAEQKRIVEFIDSKTQKIDAYVVERERELQALSKLKQSEIAAAVTRGLNPNVPLKECPNLLGNSCPENWEMIRNKSFLSLTGEKVGNRASEYTLLSLTTRGVIVRDIESGKGKFPKDFDDYQIVRHNELVFCLFDIDETPRTVGLVDVEGMITGAYTALKVDETIALPEYIYNYYICVDDIKGLKPYYSGLRKTVRADKFLQLYIPIPPIEEQRAIVEYIDRKCGNINSLISELEAEIAYLKEYKQRLIADAVTGKIMIEKSEIECG